MAPKISMIMCVYNGERYLREAIESILNQTFTDFEFIIVDDGSIDRSVDIITSYSDQRIHLVCNETNLGFPAAPNKGLAMASGVYIARMDQDDISLPERFARQVDFLDSHPDIGVLGSAIRIIDNYGTPSRIHRFPSEPALVKWCLYFQRPGIVHPVVMMRRKLVEQIAGYKLKYAQDYDLWARLRGITRFSNLPDILLYYREHESNTLRVFSKEYREYATRITRSMIFQALDEDIPGDLIEKCDGRRKISSIHAARQVTKLIHRLYRAFVTDNTLSEHEKQCIREDAAQHLGGLLRWHTHGLGARCYLLASACRLDPFVLLKYLNRLAIKNV